MQGIFNQFAIEDEKGQDNTSSLQTRQRKTSSLKIVGGQEAKGKAGSTLLKAETSSISRDLQSPASKRFAE